MVNRTLKLLLIILIGILPIWPALEFINKNKYAHYFDVSWLAITAIAVTFSLYFIYVVINKLFGERLSLKVFLTLSILLCFSQFYFDIKHAFFGDFDLEIALMLFAILSLIVCIFSWIIASTKLVPAIGIYALAVIFFPVYGLYSDTGIITFKIFVDDETNNQQSGYVSSKEKPNVYYFVFDGYLRSDLLKKHYGYDNGKFIKALEEKGFLVAGRSRSNFPVTALSINYTLNPSWANLDGSLLLRKLKSDSFYGGEKSEVQEKFQDRGYDFFMMNHLGINNVACKPNCITTKSLISFSKIQFYKTLPFYDFMRVYYPSIISSWSSSIPDDNHYALNQIQNKSEKPMFLFSHALIPHPPFTRQSDCSFSRDIVEFNFTMKTTKSYNKDWGLWRERYLDQVSCSNIQMLQIADQLQKTDPESIIFFVSDHGWKGFYSINIPSDKEEMENLSLRTRASNLMAFRAPDYCMQYFTNDITLVSSFPLIFSCLNKEKPEFVNNRSFVLRGKKKNKLVDVTDIVSLP